jgi:hypothetical protein
MTVQAKCDEKSRGEKIGECPRARDDGRTRWAWVVRVAMKKPMRGTAAESHPSNEGLGRWGNRHGSESPDGMPTRFGAAIARIRGIGRRWRNFRCYAFERMTLE